MVIIKSRWITSNVGEKMEQPDFHTLLVRTQTVQGLQ